MRLPSRRTAAVALAALVAALAGVVVTPTASAVPGDPVTSFAFTSDAGEYIGLGATSAYAPPDATFRIQGTAGSLTVSVTTATEWWYVTLAAPSGGQLAPGSYQNVARAPSNGAYPALSVSGNGRGCNTVKGYFDITALSADNTGRVTTLDAGFTQFCGSGTGALRGTIRYAAPPAADVVLTSSNPSSVEGQAVVLSAKVLPGTTPTVTFLDGSTVLGTSSAANGGVARWVLEAPSVGTHTYTAVQGAASSAPVVQTVRPGGTSLFFRSGNGESIGGGATAGFATPTATVTATGSAAGLVTVAVSEGAEWWSVDLAAAPGQLLTAGSYPDAQRAAFRSAGHPGLDVHGDGRGCNTLTGSFTVAQISFDASGALTTLDASWTQNCEGGPLAMTGRVRLGATEILPSTTTLTATSQVGGASTLTAVVTGAGAAPVGSVTFTDGTTTLGTVALDGNGQAVLPTTLARGLHSLGANYGGSARYAPSQAVASLSVTGFATSAVLSTSARGSVKVGQAVTFATVVTGGQTPTGAVALYDGAGQVAVGTLSGGRISLSWTPTGRGSHTLTARYLGDASHEPSTSGAVTVKVT